MALTHIAVVSLPVRDQEAALAFYRDVLDFEVLADDTLEAGHRWVQLRPPGSQTALTLVTWIPSMSPGGVRGLVLATDDLDADLAQLRGRGLELPDDVETAPWGRWITFSDPDGNGWVLQGPPAS